MDDQRIQVLREIEFDRKIHKEQAIESDESRRAAVFAAMIVIGLPTGLAFLTWWTVCVTFSWNEPSFDWLASFLAWGGITVVTINMLGGIFCGWLAHRFFWKSTFPVVYMAVAMALTFDVALFGWILVLAQLTPRL